jgi:signal transduction histidine kinase
MDLVRKWLLPTLSEILTKAESTTVEPLSLGYNAPQSPVGGKEHFQRAWQQWQAAIETLDILLASLGTDGTDNGLLLCGPVLPFDAHTQGFTTTIFTSTHEGQILLPSSCSHSLTPLASEIPLLPADPLQQEYFCFVLTADFGLIMSLGTDVAGNHQFLFSFDPSDIHLAWQSLRGRIMLTANHQLAHLDGIVDRFPPITPSYHWVMEFSQLLLQNISCSPVPKSPELAIEPKTTADLELLQALTHEVRTPLATIRTLTRSLLRRSGLEEQVIKRLESIDRECTEQINRMELIFQAVELSEGQAVDLTSMSFSHLLEQSLPVWQKQAERRNLNLAVDMPQQLPEVVSNPTILDRVLTGLVENFTRNLPSGSHIQVEVTPVGDQLKLQLHSAMESDENGDRTAETPGKAVGQMLTFRPETGNLSLNLKVTQDLFQSLGGKLVVKPNQSKGETMTIFLPMQ